MTLNANPAVNSSDYHNKSAAAEIMGKQTTDSNIKNNSSSKSDYELKVLIEKCNVCHSTLDTDHDLCRHHGNLWLTIN